MCGVIGVISKGRDVVQDGIVLLNSENNRGEQACGAAVFDGRMIRCYHGEGKVAEVFGTRDFFRWSKLTGSACIMQTLYSTVGKPKDKKQPRILQPFVFRFRGQRGAISYNGNLVRLEALRRQAKREGYRFRSCVSDTEVIAALLSTSKERDFLEALVEVLKKIEGKGAFSLAILYGGKLYGVRDQNGIRPLCIIKKSGKNGDSDSYIFASESSVYPSLEATRFVRDVCAGELVVMGQEGIEKSLKWTKKTRPRFCISEFIYFANPASRFFGVSVYAFRFKAGEMSAKKHPVDADVVVPVPDSGRGYGDGFASKAKIPIMGGLVKNRYSWRTFMMPRHRRSYQQREGQRTKLQAIPDVMEGRSVCLIEDSVFRASVAPNAVKMCREHGRAGSVHLRVCSPPVRHSCHLGLDTSTSKELVASHMKLRQIRDRVIHSDSLEYLSVEELKQVLRELGLSPDDFCLGCFTGEYPVLPDKK